MLCIYHRHIAESAINNSTSRNLQSHIFFDAIFLSAVCVTALHSALRSALSSAAVYYWILWFSSPNGWRAPCLFALNYWYCVYMLRCQNCISRDFQIYNVISVCVCAHVALHRIAHQSLTLFISLRVIVIFVEYDFICRCHYSVFCCHLCCYWCCCCCFSHPISYICTVYTELVVVFSRHHFNSNVAFAKEMEIGFAKHTIIINDRRWHSNHIEQHIDTHTNKLIDRYTTTMYEYTQTNIHSLNALHSI